MNSTAPENLRVYLVRHAHAGWALPGVRDFDRPLDDRGREEAARLAATMTVNGFDPDLVFCSNARRCAETLDILFADHAGAPAVERTDALYTDNYTAYLDAIGAVADPTVHSVMIVGHNPMIEDTAHALLADDPSAYQEALGTGFPTAGLLVLDCPRGVRAETGGNARFVALLSPVDA